MYVTMEYHSTLKEEAVLPLCDRQLNLEGMMPPEIGQRQYCMV